MSSLSERLRAATCAGAVYTMMCEAADEIERLRDALDSIKANTAQGAVSLSPDLRIKAFHKIASDALEMAGGNDGE